MLTIAAVVIVGMIYIVRGLFLSGGTVSVSQTDISKASLINTSADRVVRISVRGQIVADDDFRSYQIRITPDQRVLTTYKGYLNQPIDNITLGNNTPAYEQFVYALNRAKWMDSNELTGDSNDKRGICPTGYLYEFQILKGDKSIRKLWASSCSGQRGSFGLRVDSFVELFTKQIPGAQSKIGDLW